MMARWWRFVQLVLLLVALMYGAWVLSAALLPHGVLRATFTRLFSERVGKFTAWRVLTANLVPFLGIQFMNLFRMRKRPGGLYILPLFWILYGVLLGTNSFVFAGTPIRLSLAVLWQRSGFTEALAYTAGYEATRAWARWEQDSPFGAQRRIAGKWSPQGADWAYWLGGLLLLALAALREVG
jgi:hypothetical protein